MASRRREREQLRWAKHARPKQPQRYRCSTTGKHGYKNKLDALTALSSACRRKNTQRAYRCPHCGNWHLTSIKDWVPR